VAEGSYLGDVLASEYF
jgi:hypothetical protein